MIALGKAGKLFEPGDHGSTFGGNPVSCASALAVIEVLKKEKLLKQAKHHGQTIKKLLSPLEGVLEVRGRGLLLGVVLKKPVAVSLKETMQDRGVLVNSATESVIRIAPALIISDAQVKKFARVFKESLEDVLHG